MLSGVEGTNFQLRKISLTGGTKHEFDKEYSRKIQPFFVHAAMTLSRLSPSPSFPWNFFHIVKTYLETFWFSTNVSIL